MPNPESSPEIESDRSLWPQVLVVDDDLSILKLVETVLVSKGIAPTTATNIAEAREALGGNPEFAVILCDHLLPDGLGVEFLRDLRAQSPNLVRVLMTGLYDKALAMDAINSGEIYRFLVKPFTIEDLLATISQGFDRFNLASENERLQAQLTLQNEELRRANEELSRRVDHEASRAEGLASETSSWREASRGMIDLCLEILQRIDPLLSKHSQRVSILAAAIAKGMGAKPDVVEKIEIAAQLHDIALLGCRPELRAAQRNLTHIPNAVEREQVQFHASLSAQLLKFLPLPDVIEAIEQHHEYLDGSGYPNKLAGSRISAMAHILIVADAYDELLPASVENPMPRLLSFSGKLFAPEPLHALDRALSQGLTLAKERQVLLHELIAGMKLSTSIYTATGMLLVKQGQVLSRSMIEHLLQHAESNAIPQKILIES